MEINPVAPKSIISKPLALVIIGLLIGASLGLGTGYALIFPDMVNKREQAIEEQVAELEDRIDSVLVLIDDIGGAIGNFSGELSDIAILSDEQVSQGQKITKLESDTRRLQNNIDRLENDLDDLLQDFDDIMGVWEDTSDEFEDLRTSFNTINSEMDSMRQEVEKINAKEMLKAELANPGQTIVEKIGNRMYNTLIDNDKDFEDWVEVFGETPAKSLLRSQIDSDLGTLVWHTEEVSKIGGQNYQIKLVSYFPFEFSPASVQIPKMKLTITGTVNVATESIEITVNSAEIL
jgi:prefoldin subunit 5